jgi:hypothetical protein
LISLGADAGNPAAERGIGRYESVCDHPLFLFNGHGDCLAAKLRPGNVSSADDWDEVLLPEIDRQPSLAPYPPNKR